MFSRRKPTDPGSAVTPQAGSPVKSSRLGAFSKRVSSAFRSSPLLVKPVAELLIPMKILDENISSASVQQQVKGVMDGSGDTTEIKRSDMMGSAEESNTAVTELLSRVVDRVDGGARLRRLVIRGVPLGSSIAKSIGRFMFLYDQITELVLVSSHFSDADLAQMIGAIPYFTKLTSITLSFGTEQFPSTQTLNTALSAVKRATSLKNMRLISPSNYVALKSSSSDDNQQQVDLIMQMHGILAERSEVSNLTLVVDGESIDAQPNASAEPAAELPTGSEGMSEAQISHILAEQVARRVIQAASGERVEPSKTFKPSSAAAARAPSAPGQPPWKNGDGTRRMQVREYIPAEAPLISRICCCFNFALAEPSWDMMSPRSQFTKNRIHTNRKLFDA